jgi:AcrR family transcriptional regulator
VAGDDEQLDPYAERILAAARRLLLEHGLGRTSLADVARAAGVSEATLYRRFAGRDELLMTLVRREVNAFIAQMDERIGAIDDPGERLVAGFVMLCRSLRRHELVQRLMATDPGRVLPLLTVGGGPWLGLARRYVSGVAERKGAGAGREYTADPDHLAELYVRIAHSLVLTPESVLPLDDDEQLAELARATLVPMSLRTPARRPAR